MPSSLSLSPSTSAPSSCVFSFEMVFVVRTQRSPTETHSRSLVHNNKLKWVFEARRSIHGPVCIVSRFSSFIFLFRQPRQRHAPLVEPREGGNGATRISVLISPSHPLCDSTISLNWFRSSFALFSFRFYSILSALSVFIIFRTR